MNQIRYVNFQPLYNLGIRSNNLKRVNKMKNVFAGMWPLTVLTKEGFAGLKKLQEEEYLWLEEETRRVVDRTIRENPITNPREEAYLQEVRDYVRQEVSGIFHR